MERLHHMNQNKTQPYISSHITPWREIELDKNRQTDRFTAFFSKFWKLLFISDTTFSKLWSEKFK